MALFTYMVRTLKAFSHQATHETNICWLSGFRKCSNQASSEDQDATAQWLHSSAQPISSAAMKHWSDVSTARPKTFMYKWAWAFGGTRAVAALKCGRVSYFLELEGCCVLLQCWLQRSPECFEPH